MSVGQSNRTLGKHVLLNKLLGRESGMMAKARPPFIANRYIVLDLCAGDGKPSHQSDHCSPEIATKHLEWCRANNHSLQCDLYLVEKDQLTFASLLQEQYPAEHMNIDANKLYEVPGSSQKNSAVFIHADPNHVNDWPFSDVFVSSLPQYTTMLITLGCNVGGLKRLPLTERRKWFDRMDRLLQRLPSWHDAMLIVLNGDRAQWAYLLTGPKKWQEQYMKDAVAAFAYWPHGLIFARFREDRTAFYLNRDKLFLTKEEIDNVQR